MANEQHIEWLLEGAEAWNALVQSKKWKTVYALDEETSQEVKRQIRTDFRIDLSNIDFRSEPLGPLLQNGLQGYDFSNANLFSSVLQQLDIRNSVFRTVDLRKASLNHSNCWNCDFSGAKLDEGSAIGANFFGSQFVGTRLLSAILKRSRLKHAVLDEAVLFSADLTNADLRGTSLKATDLSKANLTGVDVSSIPTPWPGKYVLTDLSATRGLTQSQLNTMQGDSGTVIPEHLVLPDHWPKLASSETNPDPKDDSTSLLRFTPPAEFAQRDWQIPVQYFPQSPAPRKASATPIEDAKKAAGRTSLALLVGTFCSALRKYKREDAELSNRVRPAEQLLVTGEALHKALKADNEDFLPILMEDYIETLALGFGEDVQAFEANDIALYQRIIRRGRQLYAFFPELEEISDPTNTRFIPDDFPYSLAQLKSEVKDIVYSDEGLTHFSDTTRDLIEAELNATVPRDQDEEKTKLARLGAIVGEMRREMVKYADKAQSAIDKGASWVKSFEKVEKIWDAIKPFIGMDGGG